MIKRDSKAAAILVGATGLVLMSTSTAHAYWSTTGSGSGSATTGDAIELGTEDAAVADGLFPGMSPAGGKVVVSNPNPFDVKVVEIVFEDADTDKAGCDATGGVTFTDAALAIVVTAGESEEVPYTVSMDSTSQNACQGAVFTAGYEIKAVSQ